MFRIILGSILVIITMFLVPSVEKALFYLPLLFALSVSFVNFDKIKINHFLGLIISIIQSYLVFLGLGIIMYFFDEWFVATTQTDFSEIGGIALITLGGYFASLLLFYFYTFLFNIQNLKFSFWVINICYALVVVMMLIFSKNEYLQFGLDKFPTYLISWCIFMSLAFNLSINREEFLLITNRFKTN